MHTTTPAIMIQGTCSNAGKSLLTAGLCRIFAQEGLRPAPFKAQNMALNSFVTATGEELGRAQALQALACGRPADVRMNPVLLKPSSDTGSQVIIMGKAVGHMRVPQYIEYKERAWGSVSQAYDSLAQEAGIMVIEGAGSPAEINLRSHDIVNMRMALYAKAPVLLVGDIDRGGVFAALVGTMALLAQEEQNMVAGYVLNKFRGDASLLSPALTAIQARTGKPFMGIVPWLPRLGLPEEDSVSFKLCAQQEGGFLGAVGVQSAPHMQGMMDIVLIDLPHISNATDVDPLRVEPDVRVRVVCRPEDLGQPDAIILPGSKSTSADLHSLQESGMAEAVCKAAAAPHGPQVVGICGGLQMMGLSVRDPYAVERSAAAARSEAEESPALGLLPLITVLGEEKILRRTQAVHVPSAQSLYGYEIHHGQTHVLDGQQAHVRVCVRDTAGQALGWELLASGAHGSTTACSPPGRIWGTYLHGIFEADAFRRAFVDSLRIARGLDPVGNPTPYTLEPALDRLAQTLREHMDMEAVFKLVGFKQKK